jgi:hypothetical protein
VEAEQIGNGGDGVGDGPDHQGRPAGRFRHAIDCRGRRGPPERGVGDCG